MDIFGTHITNWISSLASSISSLASLIALCGVFFGLHSLKQSRKSYEDDHERSRRENAINMVKLWATDLDSDTSSAQKFVEGLSEDNTRHIFSSESFTLTNPKEITALRRCFSETDMPEGLKEATDKYDVTEYISHRIRWYIIQYLNLLETILLSGQHKIADQDILDTQFQYLYSVNGNTSALHRFRMIANANVHYPAITAFILRLEREANPQAHEALTLGRNRPIFANVDTTDALRTNDPQT